MNFIGYFPPLLVKVNSVRQCHPLAKLGTSSYNLPHLPNVCSLHVLSVPKQGWDVTGSHANKITWPNY